MKKLLFAATALIALSAAPAKADFYATSYNVLGGQNVTLLTPKFENVIAGQIQLNGPSGSALVWCLDVFDGINLPYDYTVSTFHAGDVRPGIQTMSDAQVRQIAALMFVGDHVGGIDKAAIQLAIWKAEYGGAFSSLASGSLLADETLYLSQSAFGGIWDRADLTMTVYTDAPINPSQAFGNATIAAVPETSTWIMMIAGFLGIGGLAMRKKGQLRLA
jgi:hypothetical protein